MKILSTLILLSIIAVCISTINPENVIIAINCGGEEFKDSNGITYEKVPPSLTN
jgi:hypothetical protein